MQKRYPRCKVLACASSIAMDAIVTLALDAIYFVVCLEFISRDDPWLWLRIFGYGQIAVPFVLVLISFIANFNFITNNARLNMPAIAVEERFLVIFERNKEQRFALGQVDHLQALPERGFRLRAKPHLFEFAYGRMTFSVRGKRYFSGYVSDVESTRKEIAEEIARVKLAEVTDQRA